MGIQLTAAAHNLEQVLALADRAVDYIRLGYPYCQPLAELLWPQAELELALEAVMGAGKIPQFQWLISANSSAQGYVDGCREVIKGFPQTEIVIGHWGGVGNSLPNTKLASSSLAIYNSHLVCLLRERGLKIISLPLGINAKRMLAAIINSSPADTTFEYQLWGPVMGGHWWRCPTGSGGCNPRTCIQGVEFGNQQERLSLSGQALWLTPGIDNLNRLPELIELGIGRGLIQLPDISPQAVAEAIDYCLARMAGKQPVSVKAIFEGAI